MTNLPLTGKITITAAFGEKGPYWATFHKGIDMICDDKTVYAPCAGTVRVVAFDEGGWGQYVTIGSPDGRIHILCHMVKGSVKVQSGEKVTRTTKIGTMGDTGNATGVHLHYQLEENGKPIDPSTWMGCDNRRYTFHSADLKVPADIENIPSWALPSVLTVYRAGLMIGDEKDRFRANAGVTRAELAVCLARLIK